MKDKKDLFMKNFNGEKVFCLEYDKETLKDMVIDLQNKIKDLEDTIENKNNCIEAYDCILEARDKRIDKAKDYLETCMINPEDLSLYENITKEECLKLLDILRGEE